MPGVRAGLALALALHAPVSTALLRAPALSSTRVVAIMGGDLLFTALLVETSGGVRSPFFGLYDLVIIASAFFYELAGGLIAAVAVLVITGVGEWLGLHGVPRAPVETIAGPRWSCFSWPWSRATSRRS